MFSKQTVNPVAKAEFFTMLKAEWLCFSKEDIVLEKRES